MTAAAILIPVRHCQKCQKETERNARGQCKACAKARFAAYKATNPQRVKERAAVWRAANSERLAVYRAENADKAKAYDASYRAANPEKGRARAAAHYAANSDEMKAANAVWKAANPEKVKAVYAAWAKANPEARRINEQNRRARKLENGGNLSKGLSDKLFKLQKGKCACCKLPLGDNYHLDHVMPLALGGSNTDDNMQLLRQRCNIQKHAKHPVDFMQSKGFLL